IDRWLQRRRGIDRISRDLPPRHWTVAPAELSSRAGALAALLDRLLGEPGLEVTAGTLAWIESEIFDTVLDIIPAADVVEGLHNRARIARALLELLHDRKDNPPSVVEMCDLVGARERTLFLSCVEAFGRSPAQLSMELRLNAVRRALLCP